MTVTPLRGTRRGPSLIFLGLLAVFGASGAALWMQYGNERLGTFLFVCSGWVISLCLHEFGHALTAYRSGDRSVAARGYLTLNPLNYANWVMSILLPLVFVIAGGIGFPGGAVWIDRSRIPGRYRHSMVSAAGPGANLIFAVLMLVPVAMFAPKPDAFNVVPADTPLAFWGALALLGFLQLTALVLNLLPVPGLDGFGIWEPWLPRNFVHQAQRYAMWGMLALFVVLFSTPLGAGFRTVVEDLVKLFGVPRGWVDTGFNRFLFWQH